MKRLSLKYPAHCQNGKEKGSCLSSDPEPATPFSLLGMQQFSAGLVLPPSDRSLLQLLSCLPFIYATTCQASPQPQHALGRVEPPPPHPTMASPVQRPTALHSSACASGPAAEPALRMAQGPFGPSAITGPHPSLQSGLARFAEGLVLTADTFGLTVNNKTKSLCTALQTLLHPPGYTAELQDRVGDLCSTLHTESLLATSASL